MSMSHILISPELLNENKKYYCNWEKHNQLLIWNKQIIKLLPCHNDNDTSSQVHQDANNIILLCT